MKVTSGQTDGASASGGCACGAVSTPTTTRHGATSTSTSSVHITGMDGARMLPFSNFHRLAGDTPQIDPKLHDNEIVISVGLPPTGFAGHHAYLKIHDRASYAFAWASVALGLRLEGETIHEVNCGLGRVAPTPWRDVKAEAWLRGRLLTRDVVHGFADMLVRDTHGRRGNALEIELTARAVVRAFEMATQRRFMEVP
jgi:xanthine dehydrogenase YagS FAD-binding subunit